VCLMTDADIMRRVVPNCFDSIKDWWKSKSDQELLSMVHLDLVQIIERYQLEQSSEDPEFEKSG
jgi:hypothetical protein